MSERKKHGSDVCFCGDYRSQHTEHGCRVCSGRYWDTCDGFKWGHKADDKEWEHWQKYHGQAAAQRAERKEPTK